LYDRAIVSYLELGNQEGAIGKILLEHPRSVSEHIKSRTTNTIRLFYAKKNKFDIVQRLSKSLDEMISWLLKEDFKEEAKRQLIALLRFDEAGEIAQEQGNDLEAARLFARSGTHRSNRRMNELLSKILWSKMPLGWIERTDKKTKEENTLLLNEAERLSDDFHLLLDIRTFKSVITDDTCSLLDIASRNSTGPSSLYALDYALLPVLKRKTLSDPDVVHLEKYFNRLLDIFPKVDPLDVPTQHLFGFRPDRSNKRFHLLPISPLHDVKDDPSSSKTPDSQKIEAASLPAGRLTSAVEAFLSDRLYVRLSAYFDIMKKSPHLFPPCASFSLLEQCIGCTRLHSTGSSAMDLISRRLKFVQTHSKLVKQIQKLSNILDYAKELSKVKGCKTRL
jgi:hypothetical protein